MALADSVPGVSGGTVALLMGFYDKFITSLNDLVSGNRMERKEAVLFLLKIGFGWIIGFGIIVILLGNIFDKYIYQISSLFFGFIVFAIPVIVSDEKETLRHHYSQILFSIVGAALVAAITWFSPANGDYAGVHLSDLSWNLGIYLFFCAVVAVSAMVLPGISGSTLLLIFGLYVPVISAVKELLRLQFQYLPAILIFGAGVITGIILVIRYIKRALEKHRSSMIYFIIGLMGGSLYAVAKGPTTMEIPRPAMNLQSFHFLMFFIGGVIILGMKYFTMKENKK